MLFRSHMTLYFGEDKQGKAPPAYLKLLGAAGGDVLADGGASETTTGAGSRDEKPSAA